MNKYYDLFTEAEIPNEEERRAVNCYYANRYPCVAKSCKNECFRLWRNCPRQTGKRYKGEEVNDRLGHEKDS